MKITGIARFALQAVIGSGVDLVMTNVIKSTIPVDATTTKKIFYKIGSWAIASAVSGYVTDKTISDIEEIFSLAYPKEKEPTPTEHPVKVGMTTEEFSEFMQGYVRDIMKAQKEAHGQPKE